jgi:osomolarity two-component system, response regulator SSK1
MVRRIWVQRPGASATLVSVGDDDLVDDVRDAILAKYSNSLGRTYDAPDISLRLVTRLDPEGSQQFERTLRPDEHVLQLIEHHFPGGQKAQEALIIDTPRSRVAATSVASVSTPGSRSARSPGQLPQPASPAVSNGSSSHRTLRTSRNIGPTFTYPHYEEDESVEEVGDAVEVPNPVPSTQPPLSHAAISRQRAAPSRQHSGQSELSKSKLDHKSHKSARKAPPVHRLSSELLDTVPPINVLIVEDNLISRRVLERKMKELGVRTETATDGQIAVEKWRATGFHLVLMDINMDIMDGLAATKEIRRLEKANGIGVYPDSAIGTPLEQPVSQNITENEKGNAKAGRDVSREDKLPIVEGLFHSPVIIVALTAGSLDSDRDAALAAGCNDFITKPPDYAWLQQKVKEWGCMQALTDFDGWKRWRDKAM